MTNTGTAKIQPGAAGMAVTFKRTSRCRTIQRRELPAGWSVSDARHYACSMSEEKLDVEIWLWVGERIEVIYRNARIA